MLSAILKRNVEKLFYFKIASFFLLFCFEGGAFAELLEDRSQNTHKGFLPLEGDYYRSDPAFLLE